MSTPPRAVLYARVSTKQQAEKYSLDYQLQQERKYAETIGATIAAEITDDQSGRTTKRDGLAEARALLSSNQADILIVYKIDRLHRKYVDFDTHITKLI